LLIAIERKEAQKLLALGIHGRGHAADDLRSLALAAEIVYPRKNCRFATGTPRG
jgi:hypothetical protein